MPTLHEKTQSQTLITHLPKLITVEDYHEFDDLNEYFKVIHPSLKVREVGFSDEGKYVGVVYISKMPSKKEINQLWEKQGLFKDTDED